jgi:predicted dehydrogenase
VTALRIGVLGSAKIAPPAIVRPARAIDEAEVVAIAARDPNRATAFASKHHIPKVHDSYAALIEDPDIDAVYNPLPNGLHGRWTIAALDAGKHVLCEKPFTANAAEAEQVAAVARRTGLVVMEAFHYRYHPLAHRLVSLTQSGELGPIRHIEAWMCTPLLPGGDIRWQLGLAGGSTMDLGCYAIHLTRSLAGVEPEVVAARARERSAGVDRWLQADMRLADGPTARITAAMLSHRLLSLGARVTCERGEIRVLNPYAPHTFHRMTVRGPDRRMKERFTRTPTYEFQLRAFVDAVLRGEPILTGPDDSIATMRVIDACYRAAGMEVRQPTAPTGT